MNRNANRGESLGLVLSRKVGESIQIDGGITLTLTKIDCQRACIAIKAPDHINIMRTELLDDAHEEG